MTATAEAVPSKAPGLRSSALKRPIYLNSSGNRLVVDPDGAIRALESLEERRSIFGFEQLWFYKVQAGIVVHAPRPDWSIRVNPRFVRMSGRVFDAEVSQTVEFFHGRTTGFIRRVSARNTGQGQLRLRIMEINDPTNAHFDQSGKWGALGVNAFNRDSHVAMDEVSDPPSARVSGSNPSPARYYMTTSRSRAQELISSGELPDATAGTSGQVLILSAHELDLAVGESRDLTFVSIYSPGKLEEVLADFGEVQSGAKQKIPGGAEISCSDQSVTEAAAWAVASVCGGVFSTDMLDGYEVLAGLLHVDSQSVQSALSRAKDMVRKDGSLPHALDQSRPGVLETSLFLKSACDYVALTGDKKLARSNYPLIKKLAGFLVGSSKDSTVVLDAGLPQGWRRHLGSGYPTGEIPEVLLATAAALESASQVARIVSKADDAGKFLERSRLIAEHVRKKLLDDRGCLSLCRDSSGRLRSDETVDMAVAAYRQPFMDSAEQAAAHRLFEKDFETPYGPRCVPTSNQVYFNSAYGEGQLGGVWTRAALAHAIICYRAGLAGMGSLSLVRVARLVVDDSTKLEGSPGTFPRWVDVDARLIRDREADPVASSRFLEALIHGELGIPRGSEKAPLSPAVSSTFSWVLGSDIWSGETGSVFVGRGGDRAQVFSSGPKLETRGGTRFAKSERIEVPGRGVRAICFYTPGQVICIGNVSSTSARFTVTFAPRAAELAKKLTSPLEEFDIKNGTWTRSGSLRVAPTMSFEASLEPNAWKAYRVSTP